MMTLITDRTETLKQTPNWSWEQICTVKENLTNGSSISYIVKLLNGTKTESEVEQKIKDLQN